MAGRHAADHPPKKFHNAEWRNFLGFPLTPPINAMIDVVSERHGESAVNEKLKAELMREYNSRYFNVPVPELPEDKPARRWWPFGKK